MGYRAAVMRERRYDAEGDPLPFPEEVQRELDGVVAAIARINERLATLRANGSQRAMAEAIVLTFDELPLRQEADALRNAVRAAERAYA